MKEQSYFPHYSQQKDSIECTLLIDQMGLEGYGIFWVLMETLRSQEDFTYPLQLLPSLARKFGTSKEKMETVVKNYNLFVIKENIFFYSESLNLCMSEIAERKLKYAKAGQKGMLNRWKKNNENVTMLPEPDNNVITTLHESNNDVITTLPEKYNNVITIKGKEIKENENKKKENKINNYAFFDSNEKNLQEPEKPKVKKEKPEKEPVIYYESGFENIKISVIEYEKLKTKYNVLTDKALELLSSYKYSSGKSYKSDYHAILTWVIEAVKEKELKNQKNNIQNTTQNANNQKYPSQYDINRANSERQKREIFDNLQRISENLRNGVKNDKYDVSF